jgi:hypothetical protein
MRWFNYLRAYTLFRILEGWGLNIFRIPSHCSNAFIIFRNLSKQMPLLQRYLVAWNLPQAHSYAHWHVLARLWGGGGKDSLFFLDMPMYFLVLMFLIIIVPLPSGSSLPIFWKVGMTCSWELRHALTLQDHRCDYVSSDVFDITWKW